MVAGNVMLFFSLGCYSLSLLLFLFILLLHFPLSPFPTLFCHTDSIATNFDVPASHINANMSIQSTYHLNLSKKMEKIDMNSWLFKNFQECRITE